MDRYKFIVFEEPFEGIEITGEHSNAYPDHIIIAKDPNGDWVRYDDIPGWVKCSEKMPEEGVEVIGYATRGGVIPYMRLEDGEWMSMAFGWGGAVTHWQPMPEAPTEQQTKSP